MVLFIFDNPIHQTAISKILDPKVDTDFLRLDKIIERANIHD